MSVDVVSGYTTAQPVRDGVATVGAGSIALEVWTASGSLWCATRRSTRRRRQRCPAHVRPRRVLVLSRLVPLRPRSDALAAVAELASVPGLHLDIVSGGWWRQRLVDHVHRSLLTPLPFTGMSADVTKHHVLQSSWVHLLPVKDEARGHRAAQRHYLPSVQILRWFGGLDRRQGDRHSDRRPGSGDDSLLLSIRCCVTNSAPGTGA